MIPLTQNRSLRSLVGLWAGLLCCFPLLSAAEFPHETSDLPVDDSVRYGKLNNGVRYALLVNREPRERTALRLLVKTGSLQENDDQRGLAHFLEHMAFNGSEHYAPGELIEFFQRMGMSFGADTNAFTSFDRTVYMIDLPNSDAEHLGEGLQVFRDYAGGMLLLDEEIEKERGIILSEKRARDSVQWRSFLAEINFFYGDTRLAHRLPIGTEEVLANADRADFLDYYDTWYRPERMTVVAVGDFDIDLAERLIKEQFGSLTARAPARLDPPADVAPAIDGVQVLRHHEPEEGSVTVGIQTSVPYTDEPDTAANRIKDLPRDLAFAMLNRRLSELAKKEGAPFSSGSGSAGSFYKVADSSSISLRTLPDQWPAALQVAENELRRALEFGFQGPELREVMASMRNGLEQAVRRAPTRRSNSLAMSILSSIADENVFTTPQANLDLFTPALDEITIEACNEAFRAAWAVDHRVITVIGNTGADQPADAEAQIAALYADARAVTLEAPPEIEDTAFAYTAFGPPGEVYSRETIEDLDLTLVEFANRVRLNVKKTDFSAQSISMSVRLGTGQLSEPIDQPGLSVYTSNTFTLGGLGAHSSDDLRRILAGRNVGVGFGIASDAFTFSGRTTPEDLLLQLQLTAAYIVDPGFRPESDRQMRKAISSYYAQLAHVPQGPLQTEVPRLLADGDPRFGLPPQEVLDQRSLDEARSWLKPELQSGAIEIALVGDLDVEAAISAVAQTFGALPTRGPKPRLQERRQVSFPAKPFQKNYRVSTEIPKGVVSLYWPTTDGMKAEVDRRLRVLANILDDRLRLKIREELGGSYSPSAGSNASDTYEGYGSINAYIIVDPKDADKLTAVTRQIADELARDGTNEDELKRAIQPILTNIRESSRTNGYWLGSVLSTAQENRQVLDWARSRYSDNESITVDEINELAARYLGREHVFEVIVLPE